ncbi:TPA: DUF4145 domain-containing protein [Vibrio parahaemolyticus]|nr:DUF4145 domain-containing protein [Vibrio vulnificus]EIZ1460490.1 DUF4145 domain-containing protein [Vibrio vulnificus]EJE8572540.1 DUF4145 domain-containing protein [Vibrio vulnificus]ELP6736918.1 DUF4145 domain-containing protein [Vibrio vulnificus]ELX4167005.1 DUF4145 domain-containing protein [Vibrio vulnificus]
MKKEEVKNKCNSCRQETWHTVEGTHSYTHNPDEYHFILVHSVVKCCGCETVSFRTEFHDVEAAYPTDYDDWEVPIEIDNFPKQEKGTIDTNNIPDVVKNIYSETCNAYRDEAYTLAGIGFRATIEAICNDQEIRGKELSTRINQLSSKGLISKRDSMRLHSIRFLGNDAAHDIKTPSVESLEAALIITEHLITTVYTLDRDSKGKLEELIDVYEQFEELLVKKLESYSNGDEFPLQQYLGKDVRLISGSLKKIEKELNTRIGKKEFTLLSFGKTEKFQGSTEKLLHYKVEKA